LVRFYPASREGSSGWLARSNTGFVIHDDPYRSYVFLLVLIHRGHLKIQKKLNEIVTRVPRAQDVLVCSMLQLNHFLLTFEQDLRAAEAAIRVDRRRV
jgi:hypothetical protein